MAHNSLEFGKSCEEISWNHCTSTPYRSETNGISERAVRRVKEGTSAVLLQSGLGNEWWADSMECYCYLRNIQDLLSFGKSLYERQFGMPFNGPVVPFGAMVEYTLFLRKTHRDYLYLIQKSCQEKSSVVSCMRRESGKTLWSQTMKNWGGWMHLKSTPEGSMQREVLTPQRGGDFILSIADGSLKLHGGDQVLRTSTLIRDRRDRGEEQDYLREESEGSFFNTTSRLVVV